MSFFSVYFIAYYRDCVLQSWPDHGTPSDPNGVLALIEDINTRMYQISQEKLPPRQVKNIALTYLVNL